ncbi:hypothetical protein C8D87_1147 [Lentzea atacamensis]|uniref:Uncharacterized protein n=1 Tax=Lentzea atacamensis TaxID=531938 RepID=A0ABX9DY27_9PSEU|nr:hypothetical protein [Lentzea atacamensis]RAS59395.1 hypothetical protein C8D87_1147 [Lentzea atacamensis]
MPPTPQSTPPHVPVPNTALTVVLLGLLAVSGTAAIVLVSVAHQLWIGAACAATTVALIMLCDQRLRRHGAARRAARNNATGPQRS